MFCPKEIILVYIIIHYSDNNLDFLVALYLLEHLVNVAVRNNLQVNKLAQKCQLFKILSQKLSNSSDCIVVTQGGIFKERPETF